ncbi:NAD(P)-dependent oxidoreductase [Dyadobacter chenhuakuii]|uniref:NAD(P)H-binding protein n=1 Tax=Dyadobacter chenhuakuii TaxID=2909339 RepID=A0A9X1TUU5_9BACT|nr:NAD(P)H-binding protein [Dyadobacter chenhuakuii]MCF2501714.1 NAD(P)H-binding protein [Dyadobacter chenhuakuii]
MKQIKKIAIIGGGGRTGQYIVNQLLEKGFYIRLLLRHPESFPLSNPHIEIIEGDVLDAEVVTSLVEDCEAVISTVGQRKGEPLVASVATENILRAIENQPSVSTSIRYILLAGLNIDTPFDRKSPDTQKATDWMKMTFPEIHADRQKSYLILQSSQVKWTLVRVPFIEFSEERSALKVSLEDCLGSKISAADIAGFMFVQLTDDTYIRKAPFIAGI